MNKRIIRIIIYEGDEELVDAYERHSLDRTQRSIGMPKSWKEELIVTKGKEIFITGSTLTGEIGLFQAIARHNMELIKQLRNSRNLDLKNASLEEPILNQLNK